jgi:addiction module RelE/StbE family toxin
MSIFIVTSRSFDKAAARLPSKIKAVLGERLKIFAIDQFAVCLNNHQLKGSLHRYRSINITGDYRLIYEEYDDAVIRLIDIGTHSHIYGK